MTIPVPYTGGNCAESLSITSKRDSAYFIPHLKIKLAGGIKPSSSPALLGASTAPSVIITPPIACGQHPATTAAKTMEVSPPHCSLVQDLQSLDDVPQARTSRSTITLPPRNSAGSSTAAAAGCCYEQRASSGSGSNSGQQVAAGGALMMRRVSTCINFGGIVVEKNGDLTAAGITGNTLIRPQQQDRHSDGRIPALKTCALLPFLMRGPRMKGSPPIRFSAYSCRDSATLPNAMY